MARAEPTQAAAPQQRLCSEIQLFDLCDLEKCRFKSDRYCTDGGLLDKFESINDDDPAEARVVCPDCDEEGDEEIDDPMLAWLMKRDDAPGGMEAGRGRKRTASQRPDDDDGEDDGGYRDCNGGDDTEHEEEL